MSGIGSLDIYTYQIWDEYFTPMLQNHVRVGHTRGERDEICRLREVQWVRCRWDDQAISCVILESYQDNFSIGFVTSELAIRS